MERREQGEWKPGPKNPLLDAVLEQITKLGLDLAWPIWDDIKGRKALAIEQNLDILQKLAPKVQQAIELLQEEQKEMGR